jgi:NAD(P)-dependent dehydrogenase (short-subunit alcohol dehydrogenase family)
MTASGPLSQAQREPELRDQTVVVVGGSSGIGVETARRARAEGADVVLTGRNPEHLQQAAHELGALSTAAFDVNDRGRLEQFFEGLSTPIDHVMVTAGGPYYAALPDIDLAQASCSVDEHLWLAVRVARAAAKKMRPAGTLLFMTGAGARRPGVGLGVESSIALALEALIPNLALEVAPLRANLIAAGFVDTPLSASLLGNDLERRRDQLRATLPIGRVVGPADIAALAVHIMSNTALTGATFDIDGGEQLVSGAPA